MTRDPRLVRLVAASNALLELRLAEVRALSHAMAKTRDRIETLSRTPVADPGLPFAATAQVEQDYRHWADARRSEENLVLARQTAEWLDARDRARAALGRADALARLQRRG